MSFRLRITLLVSLAVGVAVIGASFAVYYVDRQQQYDQVDRDLSASRSLAPFTVALGVNSAIGGFGAGQKVGQTVKRAGGRSTQIVLPRSLKAVQVTVGPPKTGVGAPAPSRFTTTTIGGVSTRVLTFYAKGRRVEISTSLLDVDRNLARLRWLLVLVSLGGIALAAALGALVAGRVIAPLRRLTEQTERIVETGDLTGRVAQPGQDEVSRLSARLDDLLATLEASLRTQRQLVADASHELRTPIATLRANVELLAAPGSLAPRERAEIRADVHEELEAMTMLVAELVELARGEESDVEPCDFRLDEVVRTVVDRAARRSPRSSFRTQLQPTTVRGVPERIERAVGNLLDNARKWSPEGEPVDVAVHDGIVEVRDRGPGIDAADRPLVFNRFYRSPEARSMPGAGLGLAIVKQITDAHGGEVSVDQAPGGGAILRLQLSPTR
jgi:two-component system, OmpR family, sensor histidine kinase MprB